MRFRKLGLFICISLLLTSTACGTKSESKKSLSVETRAEQYQKREEESANDRITFQYNEINHLSKTRPDWPVANAVSWSEADAYIGTSQTVCGPLRSMRGTEYGTFVNLGRDYPNPERFTLVYWDTWFDQLPSNAIVCATGEISLYEGVTQMFPYDNSTIPYWTQGY
ncbi:hypothetical protein NXS08_06535 [Gleimia sp. 6138-11-ORH1]|uniref:hypothetical protein n=1 Tax=Gleimia sp. 6138-11-ORH1 TaxID=2973937 RepID=UPI0021690358|nr:hypothetical protein [Gleimia sp. 6138-11-ORH1]MCS4485122.1 hypothetical protein [Gleimia sp. 6138-11-ORH1]